MSHILMTNEKNKCQHWNISDSWYQNKESIELETPSVSGKRGSLDGDFSLARIPLQTCLEKEGQMFCFTIEILMYVLITVLMVGVIQFF